MEQFTGDGWVLSDDLVWPRYPVAYCRHCGGRVNAEFEQATHWPEDWDDEDNGYDALFCPNLVDRAEPDWTPRPRRVPWLAEPGPALFHRLAGPPPAVAPMRGLPDDLSEDVRVHALQSGVRASHLGLAELLAYDWERPVDGEPAWRPAGIGFLRTMLRMAQRAAGDLSSVRCVVWAPGDGGAGGH
ncbi:hypothetical protein [Actinomadura sp. 9N407]|uniref:hypothetical protein n=1 Tax=Actinomadura sp. 9N407 TaxID=3375154 RepID=UPI0037BBDC0C